jgi:hypothetical protein
LSPAKVFDLPEAPEFLGTGDFDADGHLDVVIAARGSNVLYWFPGDGQGGFDPVEEIELPGAVTALVTGGINRRDGSMDVVVGIIGPDGPELLVFEWLEAEPKVFALPAEATALAVGQLDEDYLLDLAVAAGRELLIVHGEDRGSRIEDRESPQWEQHSFPFVIISLALGDFVWDKEHQMDIALSTDNGAVHVLVNPTRLAAVSDRQSRSKTASKRIDEWTSETLITSDQRLTTSDQLVRAKVSSLPTDDLVVLDQSNHQLHIISDLRPQTSDQINPIQRTALTAIRNPQSWPSTARQRRYCRCA